MHIHANVWGRTYMQPLYIGLMDSSAGEPSYIGMMDTSAVPVTENLFLVTNSLLYFNLEENGL